VAANWTMGVTPHRQCSAKQASDAFNAYSNMAKQG
jgi:hypothetical protein